MKDALGKVWDLLHTSYWFIPSVMALASAALVLATFEIQQDIGRERLSRLPFIFTGDIEGARAVLSAIATSMATVAGVVFSIMIVVLTLASQQLGPRLLMAYMRDTGTQVALGTFIATFIYALLVLRTIKSGNADQTAIFFPVSVGVLLSLISLGVFIFFINHMSELAQASSIVNAVGKKLNKSIKKLFPEDIGKELPVPFSTTLFPDALLSEGTVIKANRSGYIQVVNAESLLGFAKKKDLLIRLIRIPGEFVALGEPLAEVRPKQEEGLPGLKKSINRLFIIGRQRTDIQDAAYLFEQLVEVASRSLSPGINDPFTAVMCIDRFGDAMSRLAGKVLPSPFRFDEKNHLRVISPAISFVSVLENNFAPIRVYGNKSLMVLKRLLEIVGQMAANAHRSEDLHALSAQARMVLSCGMEGLTQDYDRLALKEKYMDALNSIESRKKTMEVDW